MRYLILPLSFFWSGILLAQGSFLPRNMERAGTWETNLTVTRQDSGNIGGLQGTSIDFDSETGFGFGVSYNFNNHLSLGGEFLFARPDYQARFVDEDGDPYDINHTASVFTGQLRGTWNILSGPLTPFVEGSMGWTNIDSNVANGPPVTGCWWDPWLGYICREFFSTYNDTSFSYSVGVGGRWDITPGFAMRAGYTRKKIDLGSSTEDPEVDSARIDLIWRY